MAKRVRSVDMSTVGERNTVFVSVEVRDAALALCEGSYQRGLVLGGRKISGADCGARYGGSYAASRASLRAKLTAAGIHNEVAKAARGRCVWLIGCKAKVVKTKEVAVVAG